MTGQKYDPTGGETDAKGESAEDHWNLVSFVIRSQYRVAVLEHLSDGPAVPSRIASHSDFSLSHISRAIQELRERDLIELLVSEQQKVGRLYGTTHRAEVVWDTIESERLN